MKKFIIFIVMCFCILQLKILSYSQITISQVKSSSLSSTSVAITWDTNEGATSQVEYGPSASYGLVTIIDSNLVTSHSIELTGLTPNTKYHYRVKSKDAYGNESISLDSTFYFLEGLPSPTIVSTTHPEHDIEYINSTAKFIFSVPGTEQSEISGYRYIVDGNPDTLISILSEGIFVSWDTIILSNLSDGVHYFHVVAVNINDSFISDNTAHYKFIVHLTLDSTKDIGIIYGTVFDSTKDTRIIYSNDVVIDIPADTLNSNTLIELSVPDISSLFDTFDTFDYPELKGSQIIMEIKTSDGIEKLSKEITIEIPYTINGTEGLNEENLKLCYWDKIELKWKLINNSRVDKIKRVVIAKVNHLTIFRIVEFFNQSISNILVYPNPCKNNSQIEFSNLLSPESRIKIYTISGKLVKTLQTNNNNITWNLTNDSGSPVVSGIYIYCITNSIENKKGKLAIIR